MLADYDGLRISIITKSPLVTRDVDVLARIALGRADDLLTAIVLCATCPILVAPAMHPNMWANPATQRNVALAQKYRINGTPAMVFEDGTRLASAAPAACTTSESASTTPTPRS